MWIQPTTILQNFDERVWNRGVTLFFVLRRETKIELLANAERLSFEIDVCPNCVLTFLLPSTCEQKEL